MFVLGFAQTLLGCKFKIVSALLEILKDNFWLFVFFVQMYPIFIIILIYDYVCIYLIKSTTLFCQSHCIKS